MVLYCDRADDDRHALHDLPAFAVPLFLRIVSEAALNSTGVKQDKVRPRREGIDPSLVGTDRLYVLRKGRYEPFTLTDWEDLVSARAKL